MTPTLRGRIEAVMNGPHRTPVLSGAALLGAVAAVYGGAVKARERAYRQRLLTVRRLPCRVLSVGNLVLGGTGKTPMTVYVARRLHAMGYRVAVVSRGYGGGAESRGGIVSDGRHLQMEPGTAGDEPLMMARMLENVPVLVGRDRVRIGRMAIAAFAPDVIVLDDGFQHLRLHRDLNLVLLDAERPFGNGHLFPRGTLREPASALYRADACVLTRCPMAARLPAAGERVARCLEQAGRPVFTAAHRPYAYRAGSETVAAAPPAHTLPDRAVYAFSGIARNADFVGAVETLGGRLVDQAAYPDHYPYPQAVLERICERARRAGAEMIVTTTKDHARIGDRFSWPLPLWVVGVAIALTGDSGDFDAFLDDRIARAAG